MNREFLRALAALAILTVILVPAAAIAGYDHSEIEGPFANGPAVTKKCLECHEKEAMDVMRTSHWTWTVEQKIEGTGTVQRGKKNVINNFCVAITSNEPRCTSCHIGYGWKDASFDFTDKTRVDCLACHDTTGTYKKNPKGAGMPMDDVDLLNVARNIGAPSRINCGTCHFYGGGGDKVKHGDLDSSMGNPSRELDIHMSPDGEDFTCQECHESDGHSIKGNAMVVSPTEFNHLGCDSCHGEAVHKESRLNKHAKRVACQTCHIPSFAREFPTKVYWDWSTAGEDREPESDENSMPTYHKMKGTFKWARNIIPTYAWHNEKAGVYTLGDKIDPRKVTPLSWPNGNRKDQDARIYPFKVMEGRQPYDIRNKTLIVPKLFGKGGYWQTYDWDQTARLGMEAVGLPYSGEYGWTGTIMYWKINHMVAPAENSLGCLDCHGDGGRMDWKALGYKKDPMN
ncbi:MAG: tetrathionate reductase family octaheme c-type cytochrome [bacterium]|nr:tetrathionate reductase family octaheme c-type cytochrome [bacterium]